MRGTEMKIDLAVYTAQEGYSWQPGTALTTDELVRFKKSIGKFPSSDSMDLPFGGVFLLEDRVVFYRYHVAKKIDFRGRDALYCVLGAVSREDAAKIDPAALFACPEFAGPMKPFPTEMEIPEADSSAVPEWLKNLDKMTLDVRITGTAENPSYAVVQNPIEIPEPPVPIPPVPTPPVPTPPVPPPPVPTPPVPEPPVTPGGNSGSDSSSEDLAASSARRRLIWRIASAAAMVALLIGGSLWFAFGKKQEVPQGNNDGVGIGSSPTGGVETVEAPTDTNNSQKVTTSTNGVTTATNAVDVSTNAENTASVQQQAGVVAQSTTNVTAVATNTVPAVKTVPATPKEKKVANPKEEKAVPATPKEKKVANPKEEKVVPATPKEKKVANPKEEKAVPATTKEKKAVNTKEEKAAPKKNSTVPKSSRLPAAKKTVPPQRQPPKGKAS